MNGDLRNRIADAEEQTSFHACGLHLTREERGIFDAVPPARVIFKTHGLTDLGDIYLDTFDTGWGSRADAERAAAYFGTVVVDAEAEVPAAAKHPRRTP